MTTNESFCRFVADLRSAAGDASTQIVIVRSTASTNELARRIHDEFSSEGLTVPGAAIFAYEQTAGKGRHGRDWESAPGLGVYTTALRSGIDDRRLAILPLVVAGSLCLTLRRHLGERCGVKWPNDLVVDGRKLGGVLIEASGTAEDGRIVAIGVGVNHGHGDDELPTPDATSCVREADPDEVPPLGTLAWELMSGLVSDLEELGREEAVERFVDCLVHREGEELEFRVGDEVVRGRFARVTEEGHLRLELDDGTERTLSSGEIVQ